MWKVITLPSFCACSHNWSVAESLILIKTVEWLQIIVHFDSRKPRNGENGQNLYLGDMPGYNSSHPKCLCLYLRMTLTKQKRLSINIIISQTNNIYIRQKMPLLLTSGCSDKSLFASCSMLNNNNKKKITQGNFNLILIKSHPPFWRRNGAASVAHRLIFFLM